MKKVSVIFGWIMIVGVLGLLGNLIYGCYIMTVEFPLNRHLTQTENIFFFSSLLASVIGMVGFNIREIADFIIRIH